MTRKTELATIYRELTSIQMRMLLVGAYTAEREIREAMRISYEKYRKEVERIAKEAAEGS